MAETLEQELEQLIQSEDYTVRIFGDSYLHVTVFYLPRVVVRGEGSWSYVANGQIAHRLFGGRRRWRNARKWVQQEIAGHRELIKTVSQA